MIRNKRTKYIEFLLRTQGLTKNGQPILLFDVINLKLMVLLHFLLHVLFTVDVKKSLYCLNNIFCKCIRDIFLIQLAL